MAPASLSPPTPCLSPFFFPCPTSFLADVPVFRGFTLDVPAGQTVALVGESGSGKSTAIGLVERFYDPSGGQVLLDDCDLRSLQLRWLRSQIGLVSQEPTLFATSIMGNLLYGRPGERERGG